MDEALELLEMLNSMDEDVRIDAKTGSKADRSILESICAFSNEPNLGGGKIILGVSAKEADNDDGVKSYKVVGVMNPDKLQSNIASQCADSFNISIRPSITVEKIEGKNVVIINVSELDERSKPLFFKNEGLPRGAYRRIGSTDQRCTEDDMPLFYSTTDSYDSALVDDTSMDDIDENAVERYRSLRETVNPHAEELSYNDQDLLIALGACKRMPDKSIKLTHTGLLVFGKSMSQRRLIPAVRVDYIRVPGTEWLQNPDTRFDTIDMRGPLILVVNRAYNAIVDDISKGFTLADGDIQAKSHIGLPSKTLREAIVNSLIHRTAIWTENSQGFA
ncbi:MAG: putative DNA binding domain-containing protein [Bacteroidales bacterium]|nr:putative DNA binding domain-containing protein [Bacteroidales bacterium]